ncbi:type II toxin-antitoxin system RelE/ParE family toxin [Thalassobaculum sp.]|uniref:type II toxin-antitoxin system RelE/ParE family toxin n=1 Tax=Thalassobaculum sp. TaxID=2022740 RepID=UPI0032EF90C5
MSRVRLSSAAAADLRSIAVYTASTWGRQQARDYQEALRKRLRMLAGSPGMGHERPAVVDGLLSFPAESHVVYYTETGDGILVVRILHKRQDPFLHVK